MDLPYSTLALMLRSQAPWSEPALCVSWAQELLSADVADDSIVDLAICDPTEWERIRLVAPRAFAAVGFYYDDEIKLRTALTLQLTAWLESGTVSGATVIGDYLGHGWSHEEDPWREQIVGFLSDLAFIAEGVNEGWAKKPKAFDPPDLTLWVLGEWREFLKSRRW